MSQNLLVVGLQWGDEGKGKIIDVLSEQFDIVARFQGGANAGHTVKIDDREYVLHLIPSGILRSEKQCVIGNGVAVDPEGLAQEVQDLREAGVTVDGNLAVSGRAHMVMPFHKLLDNLSEESLGKKKIGTTGRGIGPSYADKAARTGLRCADLLRPQVLRQKLSAALKVQNRILTRVYEADPFELEDVYEDLLECAEKIGPFIKNTVVMMHRALAEDRSILLEGAQGAMLDINFGTYPYVTSSDVVAGGASVGTGLPPTRIDRTLGVVKAYCSRVGRGPFPTEQDNEVGEKIRERGDEYGSTTGRPRRCGWLDLVALRHAVAVNGADSIVLTLLDVLSEFETVKVCVAYEKDGTRIEDFPPDLDTQRNLTPVYEELPGWGCEITEATEWDELPSEARSYVETVGNAVGARVEMVSVGPRRSQIVRRR
jgi:adenylosuccinate synthase